MFLFIILLWLIGESRDVAEERLILTPYIESGYIQEARALAQVRGDPFFEDIPSYSGYFTVNKTYNSNLFFWFFPAETDFLNAPVLLWLNGGPGYSSLFGLFEEIGPFSVSEDDTTLLRNPYSWHRNHSILFIDNPVGTGFSFTDFNEGYATEQTQIGAELYIALVQFLKIFPELQNAPLYLSGESYAGKYIPSLASTIHQRNPTADLKLNLQGIAIGNGFTDPLTMVTYSPLFYQLGLIDTKTYHEMQGLEEKSRQLIREEKYREATWMVNNELNLLYQLTGFSNINNFLYPTKSPVGWRYTQFLNSQVVRKAIHVGDASFTQMNYEVVKFLEFDLMASVRPVLEDILEHYRVLYYSGGMDLLVPYSSSVCMFNKLEFSAAEEYRNAKRVPWYVDGELAGYIKSAGKFTEVLVRNAGHTVPTDQPKWALDLINRFTNGTLGVHKKK